MKKLSLLLTFALVFFGLTSCDSTNDNGGTGTMSVAMTDAPANYDAVTITINSIQVKKDDDDNDSDGEDSDNDSEDGWVTVVDNSMEVNLLELTNGNQITLGSDEVEAGNYSQIRLVLGDNNTVTVDGETHTLQTPSGQQSGLKLNVDADVEDESTYNLLIDFDAARSIVQQGNGGYLLKPVIRVVSLEEAGSIIGNVEPTNFKTNVLAIADEDTITSTITADNGDFKIIGLQEGTYDVAFDPSSDQYSDSTQTDIEVTSGTETDLGTIQLESTSTL